MTAREDAADLADDDQQPGGLALRANVPANTEQSTASRGPYHFVSWSATMTEGMASGDHRAAGLRGRRECRTLLGANHATPSVLNREHQVTLTSGRPRIIT
jgi:hypothetical protein